MSDFDAWALPDDVLLEALENFSAAAASSSSTAEAPARANVQLPRTGWGSLKAPTNADVKGRGGGTKGLSAPPPPLTHLVVVDFEWTADDRKKMLPCSEITQFPSVLVRLSGTTSHVVDEFDTFVRPTFNPTLTSFAKTLTAIAQADVDAAPTLDVVLVRYTCWLQSHGLCDAEGGKLGSWCFCTWSDADIGGQLASECRHKVLTLPSCFESWVDLKEVYGRHYKIPPRGGLQACVERLGLEFSGRAHNGLVDSQNTAKIVLHMARGEGFFGPAFVFRRPTRGLDTFGYTYGSKASREAKRQHQEQRELDGSKLPMSMSTSVSSCSTGTAQHEENAERLAKKARVS